MNTEQRNRWWRISKTLTPVTGAAFGLFLVNFLVQSATSSSLSALFFVLSIFAFFGFMFCVFVGNLPSAEKWTLPEAVYFLGFGEVINRDEWSKLVVAKTGYALKLTKNIDDGERTITRLRTDPNRKPEFKEKAQNGVHELIEAGRSGKLSATGFDYDAKKLENIHESMWLGLVGLNVVANSVSFKENPFDTSRLGKRLLHEITIPRDEVLALRHPLLPLNPPRNVFNQLGEAIWKEYKTRSFNVGLANDTESNSKSSHS